MVRTGKPSPTQWPSGALATPRIFLIVLVPFVARRRQHGIGANPAVEAGRSRSRQAPGEARPDAVAHHEAAQRADGGESRESRAAGEIDRAEMGDERTVEAVDR